jgi:hypothetical protein
MKGNYAARRLKIKGNTANEYNFFRQRETGSKNESIDRVRVPDVAYKWFLPVFMYS